MRILERARKPAEKVSGPKYANISEARELLRGPSDRAAYKWMRERGVRPTPGNRKLYRVADIVAAIEGKVF